MNNMTKVYPSVKWPGDGNDDLPELENYPLAIDVGGLYGDRIGKSYGDHLRIILERFNIPEYVKHDRE